MMRRYSVLIILIGLLIQSSIQQDVISLRQLESKRRQFVDQYGRQRFFHGINAVVKGPPWIPETGFFNPNTSLVDKDFEYLRRLGMNVIRLGTMWPGAEPENGQFNETYLQQLLNLTKLASSYGIYTLLDMHQDVLSEKFCGEGAPYWAVFEDKGKTFPWPVGPPFNEYWVPEYKFPTRQECNQYPWANLYSAQQTGIAFQYLYQNATYIGYWQRFWNKIAQTFLNQSQIIGVELINEPWAGDTINDPLLYIPSVADRVNLQPVYGKLAESVWQADPQRLVFFAGVTWDDQFPTGFQHAPGGDQNANRSVFAFHYYAPPQYTYEPYFKVRVNDANYLETGAMLTEFGGYPFQNSSVTDSGVQVSEKRQSYFEAFKNPHKYLEQKLKPLKFEQPTFEQKAEACDQYFLSWAMWEYKSFCQQNYTTNFQANITQDDEYGSCKTGYGGQDFYFFNGSENIESAKHFARTYPQAVAGNTTLINFVYPTANFTLSYQIDKTIQQPTIIYLNKPLYYPNGYNITIYPRNAVFISEQGNYQVKLVNNQEVAQGTEVNISINAL